LVLVICSKRAFPY